MSEDNTVTDVTQVFPRWTVETVQDLTKGTIKTVDNQVCYSQEVDEYKKGEKTGKRINIYMVHVEIGSATKPAKFGSESMVACSSAWGKDPRKWHAKKIIAKHSSVGKNKYIVWVPEGTLGEKS